MLIDRELRDEWEEEFKINADDTSYRYFTHEEQIERYAKSMLFWIKHKPNIELDDFMGDDSYTKAKFIYVSDYMTQLQHKISELPPSLQKAINERIQQLLS